MLNYNNFTKELNIYFPNFINSEEYKLNFPDGGFDEPFLVCSVFFEWYISINKSFFIYRKDINKLFSFCNYVYSFSDKDTIEIIKDSIFKELLHRPFLRRRAYHLLDSIPQKDLRNIYIEYRKNIFSFK